MRKLVIYIVFIVVLVTALSSCSNIEKEEEMAYLPIPEQEYLDTPDFVICLLFGHY